MGEAARSHIRWNYDLNKNYQKMEVVLQEVIKK
jgi:hypothetical protein